MSSKPLRTLLTVVMNLLVIVAMALTVRLVVMFFGQIASLEWAKTVVSITNLLVIPFGIDPIKTPYGGVFDANAALDHPCRAGRRVGPEPGAREQGVARFVHAGGCRHGSMRTHSTKESFVANGNGSEKLGEMLVASGLVTEEQLGEALDDQARDGGRLGEKLVRNLVVTEEQIAATLAAQKGLSHVNLASYPVDPVGRDAASRAGGPAQDDAPDRFHGGQRPAGDEQPAGHRGHR